MCGKIDLFHTSGRMSIRLLYLVFPAFHEVAYTDICEFKLRDMSRGLGLKGTVCLTPEEQGSSCLTPPVTSFCPWMAGADQHARGMCRGEQR